MTQLVSTALSTKAFDAIVSEFHYESDGNVYAETQDLSNRNKKGRIAAMQKARAELSEMEIDFNALPDSSAIADTGATDHNLKDFLVGDVLYSINPPLYIQTANGVKECDTRIRRYSPALDGYVDGFSGRLGVRSSLRSLTYD